MADHLQDLRAVLGRHGPGPLPAAHVEAALVAAWPHLAGSNVEATDAAKLCGRIEDLTWDPPRLRFRLERHGRTVRGSTRGDLHAWTVDVSAGTAACCKVGHRQLVPIDAPLRVEPLAAEIAKAVAARRDHPHLRWAAGRDVARVILDDLLQADFKQTLVSRRKRFREALLRELDPHGWRQVPGRAPHTYAPVPAEDAASAPRAVTDCG